MHPLSFVAFFAIGELGMMTTLAVSFSGGPGALWTELVKGREVLFWLLLAGFVWVMGDLFQQYAAKYVGISRGIPLSNTNQLWGLLWGVFVFGELTGAGPGVYWRGVCGGGAAPAIFRPCLDAHTECPSLCPWPRSTWRAYRPNGSPRASTAPSRSASALRISPSPTTAPSRGGGACSASWSAGDISGTRAPTRPRRSRSVETSPSRATTLRRAATRSGPSPTSRPNPGR